MAISLLLLQMFPSVKWTPLDGVGDNEDMDAVDASASSGESYCFAEVCFDCWLPTIPFSCSAIMAIKLFSLSSTERLPF